MASFILLLSILKDIADLVSQLFWLGKYNLLCALAIKQTPRNMLTNILRIC
jgi:hypothetical protein